MLDDLRRIFRQSVDAFRSEIRFSAPEDQVAEILTAMRKEMVAVRAMVSSLANDLVRAGEELDREREALELCERRGAMAKSIGDDETVRVAEDFAHRHRDKVRILVQKKLALEEEIALRKHESEEMTKKYREADANRFVLLAQLRQAAAREARAAPPPGEPDPFADFTRMEERVTGTADYLRALDELDDSPPPPSSVPDPAEVEDRLRELKRKMGRE
jgi:hypothetical protein